MQPPAITLSKIHSFYKTTADSVVLLCSYIPDTSYRPDNFFFVASPNFKANHGISLKYSFQDSSSLSELTKIISNFFSSLLIFLYVSTSEGVNETQGPHCEGKANEFQYRVGIHI